MSAQKVRDWLFDLSKQWEIDDGVFKVAKVQGHRHSRRRGTHLHGREDKLYLGLIMALESR